MLAGKEKRPRRADALKLSPQEPSIAARASLQGRAHMRAVREPLPTGRRVTGATQYALTAMIGTEGIRDHIRHAVRRAHTLR